MKQIGPRPVIDLVRKMGITSKIDPYPAICLGTPDISIIEMVGAYSTYANGGICSKPIYITKIEDKYGNVIKEFVDQQTEVISDQTAYVMNQMMQGVIKQGTGMRLRNYGLDMEIAGKTGTTQSNTDGWFIGMTPQLVAGAWVGCDDPVIHFFSTAYGQGAAAALPIWGNFFKRAFADKSLKLNRHASFPTPDEISIEMDCSNYTGGTTRPTEGEGIKKTYSGGERGNSGENYKGDEF
jgi:penicillin-binding protein 1A